ncbi:MAG: LA_3696 family protein, partial [bacterium]
MLITIPKVLREKLGEEGAHGLVELLNSQSQHSGDSITTFVEEKFERRLSEELSKLRAEMHKGQAATIRWMFVFWVGQIGA